MEKLKKTQDISHSLLFLSILMFLLKRKHAWKFGILILIVIGVYMFKLMSYKPEINRGWANFIKQNCHCPELLDIIKLITPSFIPSYYSGKENLISSYNENFPDYCSKTPHFNFNETLSSLLASKKKLLVAVMLHNNEQVFPFWFSEFERLIQLLKPLSPFVSLLESHSKDLTPLWYPPPPLPLLFLSSSPPLLLSLPFHFLFLPLFPFHSFIHKISHTHTCSHSNLHSFTITTHSNLHSFTITTHSNYSFTTRFLFLFFGMKKGVCLLESI